MNVYEGSYVREIKSRQWIVDPVCSQVGENIFFPQGEHDLGGVEHFSVEDAQRVCLMCPLVEACASYAIVNGEEYGVWGSLNATRVYNATREYRTTGVGLQILAAREINTVRRRMNHVGGTGASYEEVVA